MAMNDKQRKEFFTNYSYNFQEELMETYSSKGSNPTTQYDKDNHKFWKIVFELAYWWQKEAKMTKDDSLWKMHQVTWRKHGKELQEMDWNYYRSEGRDRLKPVQEQDPMDSINNAHEFPDTSDIDLKNNGDFVPTARQVMYEGATYPKEI